MIFQILDLTPTDAHFLYTLDKLDTFDEKDQEGLAYHLAQIIYCKEIGKVLTNYQNIFKEIKLGIFAGIRQLLHGQASEAIDIFNSVQKFSEERLEKENRPQ